MAAPNFELISELQMENRRDFPLNDSTLLNPIGTLPLLDGEWLELNSSYKLIRGGDGNPETRTAGVNLAVYPVHTERGRYDTQAIGKVNVLFHGQYEAETLLYQWDGFTMATDYAVGTQLAVVTLDNDDANDGRRGLCKATGASGEVVVGYVTKPPTAAGQKLRFQHLTSFKTA